MMQAERRIIRRAFIEIAAGLFSCGLFMGLMLGAAAPIESRGGWAATFLVLAVTAGVVAVHGVWRVATLRVSR